MNWMRRTELDGRDIVAVVGFISLVYGVAQWSGPAAFVVAGVVLLASALWPVLTRKGP